MEFPIFKTKVPGLKKGFDLNSPKERREYFRMKGGEEINKLKEYFREGNSFIVYLLGKKNSGKGTYSKLFAEVVGSDKVEHFSIGDMIRKVDGELKDKKKKKELVEFLEKNYRGWASAKELISVLEKRSTKTLLPTELILALIKREIGQKKKKTLFIDGFPRGLDQMNFTLFFRDLIGYRDDPDIFALIDVPDKVIDERIKHRRVCPSCQTSRNIKLLPTSKIGYEQKEFKEDKSSSRPSPSGEGSVKEFYLVCDNPECSGKKMLPKEGDEKGIGPIKQRLKKDEELLKQAYSLYGIPKVLLRNSIPQSVAKQYVDDYEITPEYYYVWDEKNKKVVTRERPWIVKDNEGRPSYSLLAAPVALNMIKQIVKVLNL